MQSLTKREKILLIILAFVIAIVAGTVLIVMPLVNKWFDGRTAYTELQVKKSSVQIMLKNDSAEARLDEQNAIAEEYSGQFYSMLNTYTIDNVFNSLAAENNLTVKNFHISEYVPAEADVEQADDSSTTASANSSSENETGILLKATADITVSGSYDDMMHFLDNINQKSFSLNTTSIQLQSPQSGSNLIEGIFIVDIYGVALAERNGNIKEEIYK